MLISAMIDNRIVSMIIGDGRESKLSERSREKAREKRLRMDEEEEIAKGVSVISENV